VQNRFFRPGANGTWAKKRYQSSGEGEVKQKSWTQYRLTRSRQCKRGAGNQINGFSHKVYSACGEIWAGRLRHVGDSLEGKTTQRNPYCRQIPVGCLELYPYAYTSQANLHLKFMRPALLERQSKRTKASFRREAYHARYEQKRCIKGLLRIHILTLRPSTF